MDWRVWGLAFALFLVIEAFLPVVAPDLWRKILAQISREDDGVIQKTALLIMLVGVLLLLLFCVV